MSSFLFPKLLPTPHTERAWFPSSYDIQNSSTLDLLELEEEKYAQSILQIANTPAPDPIGSKVMPMPTHSHNVMPVAKLEDEEASVEGRSRSDRFQHLRRRRRHRVGAVAARHRSRRLPREESEQDVQEVHRDHRGGDDSSTVVANRSDLYMDTEQSSLDMEDMDVSSIRATS